MEDGKIILVGFELFNGVGWGFGGGFGEGG